MIRFQGLAEAGRLIPERPAALGRQAPRCPKYAITLTPFSARLSRLLCYPCSAASPSVTRSPACSEAVPHSLLVLPVQTCAPCSGVWAAMQRVCQLPCAARDNAATGSMPKLQAGTYHPDDRGVRLAACLPRLLPPTSHKLFPPQRA